MPGDLHTHTTFSDGSLAIEVLPRLAARAGLTHLAISDHDTLAAAEYAGEHPREEGVSLLAALELSAIDPVRGRRVHVLCYAPQPTQQLRNYCNIMAARRNAVADVRMIQLEQMYPQFRGEDVQQLAARSGIVYKAQIMRLLFECGYTDGIYKDLYQKLFGKQGGVLKGHMRYESVDAVLAMARAAGGVVVLAHPSVYDSMELARELAEDGRIDGVEIDHPRNTPQDRETLQQLAQQHHLIMTGGSDFHGMHMSHPTPLGTCVTSDEMIQEIEHLAQQRAKAMRDMDESEREATHILG